MPAIPDTRTHDDGTPATADGNRKARKLTDGMAK